MKKYGRILDQYNLTYILDDTKLSKFGCSALLRFAQSGNKFLYRKIVWSTFHGGLKSILQLQNLTTIIRMVLCREM